MGNKNLKSQFAIPDFNLSPKIDKVGVEERVARFQTRSIKNQAKLQGLRMALSMIDLTTSGRERYTCKSETNVF